MTPLGWLHTACAVVALASGATVLVRRKGTRSHRRIGWVYVVSMIAANSTALMIYRLSGRFGPFHGAALFSLATLVGGMLPAIRRRPPGRWVEHHYYWMTYSYAGLAAAAASEAATRLPGTPFWWAVLLATAGVLTVAAVLISRRARITLSPFRDPSGAGAPERVG